MLKEGINLEEVNKHAQNSMVGHLGIVITEVGKDYICGTMPVDNRTKQPFGLLHGGASVVLAETLGSYGSGFCLDLTKNISVGMEVNANHIKSATEGTVYGKATLLHLGKKSHIWDIRIKDDKGSLVCVSRLTVAILERK